jgi:hypothetical protein
VREEAIIQLILKQQRQVVSIDVPEALKALVIAIRLPKAKRARGEKKGKDSIKIDG